MPKITLEKPIEHEGETWEAIDFDPSLGGLEDFEDALRDGASEIKAMIDLIVQDSGAPREVVRKLRQSQLEAVQAEIKPAGPLTSSSAPSGAPGAPSQPIRHTS